MSAKPLARRNESDVPSTEQQLSAAIEALEELVVVFDEVDRIIVANKAWRELNKAVIDFATPGNRFEDYLKALLDKKLVPEAFGREKAWLRERLRRHFHPGKPFEVRRTDGRWVRISEQRFPSGGGILIVADITDSKSKEEALRESDSLLKETQRVARIGSWEWDEERQCTTKASDEALRIFGSATKLEDEGLHHHLAQIHPDDHVDYQDLYQETHDFPRPYEFRYRMLHGDGTCLHVEEIAAPMFDQDARLVGYRGTIQDISERVITDQKLRETQKMDALGRLTGGVAHEFNNMLAVILGNAELLMEAAAKDEPHLEAIVKAARRSADLTQRLLAYTRNQTLEATRLDVAEALESFATMVRHSLGEAISVETKAEPGLWNCKVDVGQLECALLNLAVNARDAMPQGGLLTIEARNVHVQNAGTAHHQAKPGSYVQLAIKDRGQGMSAQVLENAFEPFFTTKEVGQGSGLGLSMVYGFTTQSGGAVRLESAPDQGTTVFLYLPRA